MCTNWKKTQKEENVIVGVRIIEMTGYVWNNICKPSSYDGGAGEEGLKGPVSCSGSWTLVGSVPKSKIPKNVRQNTNL